MDFIIVVIYTTAWQTHNLFVLLLKDGLSSV